MDTTSAPPFDPGSFRDPDARVFYHDGAVLRCLTAAAFADWTRLSSSAFYQRGTGSGSIVATEQFDDRNALQGLDSKWVAVLRHEEVPVISYPYEWPFGMLKDAALLQLDLTLGALDDGLTLKDATPYNIQWFGTTPRFIDIGSFTEYEPGKPWTGYQQFCKQFLYPLFLQAYKNIPYHAWLRGSLDGIEAEHCRALLSSRDYLRPGVLTHVYLQARAQSHYEGSDRDVAGELRSAGFGAAMIRRNVQGLRRIVERLQWTPPRSTWSEYTREHSYGDADFQRKSNFVRRVLASRRWKLVWDLGSNTGTFSRHAAEHADYVLALDGDHLAVERMYGALKQERNDVILPLLTDIVNPSPALGWRGLERHTLADRGAPELILCLALIHHLVIGRNIPMAELVEWLAGFGAELIIEFVETSDPMVKKLLRNRGGQPIEYSAEALEHALAQHFGTTVKERLDSGTRTLYHVQGRRGG